MVGDVERRRARPARRRRTRTATGRRRKGQRQLPPPRPSKDPGVASAIATSVERRRRCTDADASVAEGVPRTGCCCSRSDRAERPQLVRTRGRRSMGGSDTKSSGATARNPCRSRYSCEVRRARRAALARARENRTTHPRDARSLFLPKFAHTLARLEWSAHAAMARASSGMRTMFLSFRPVLITVCPDAVT